MELVEQYRRYAEEARANARIATDPNTKRDWLEIANSWAELAEARLDGLGAKHPSGPRSRAE